MIIERSSKDIENETIALFNECKPYLDKGYSFTRTIRIVKDITSEGSGFTNLAWYKRFKEFAISQGYKSQDRRKRK